MCYSIRYGFSLSFILLLCWQERIWMIGRHGPRAHMVTGTSLHNEHILLKEQSEWACCRDDSEIEARFGKRWGANILMYATRMFPTQSRPCSNAVWLLMWLNRALDLHTNIYEVIRHIFLRRTLRLTVGRVLLTPLRPIKRNAAECTFSISNDIWYSWRGTARCVCIRNTELVFGLITDLDGCAACG